MATLNLERTRITVPFDGRIKPTLLDLGQYVSTGSALATVYNSTMVEVRLPLTDQQAALIDLPYMDSSSFASPLPDNEWVRLHTYIGVVTA